MRSLFGPAERAQLAAVLAHHAGSDELAGAFQAQSIAAGIDPEELLRQREGYAREPRLEAAIRFAHAVLVTRGRLEPRDRGAALRRGLVPAELDALAALTAEIAAEVIRVNARAA